MDDAVAVGTDIGDRPEELDVVAHVDLGPVRTGGRHADERTLPPLRMGGSERRSVGCRVWDEQEGQDRQADEHGPPAGCSEKELWVLPTPEVPGSDYLVPARHAGRTETEVRVWFTMAAPEARRRGGIRRRSGPRTAGRVCRLLQLVVGWRAGQELPPLIFGHVGRSGRLEEVLEDGQEPVGVPPRQEVPGAFEDLESGPGDRLGGTVGMVHGDDPVTVAPDDEGRNRRSQI